MPIKKDAPQQPENKPKRKRSGGMLASTRHNLQNCEPEDIGRIVHESYQYFGRKLPKDNQEFADRLNDYFAQCVRDNQIPTVEDMALALGTTRQMLWNMEHVSKNKERAGMISIAKEIIAGTDAKLAAEGKIPQVVYIFRAKNYHGLKDQQEVVLTPNQPLGEQKDAESLRRKYIEAADGSEVEVVG